MLTGLSLFWLVSGLIGLVSDFLSECWSRLRMENRLSAILGRFEYGGALSGRDTNGVNRTVNGLLKVLHPDPEAQVPDEEKAFAAAWW